MNPPACKTINKYWSGSRFSKSPSGGEPGPCRVSQEKGFRVFLLMWDTHQYGAHLNYVIISHLLITMYIYQYIPCRPCEDRVIDKLKTLHRHSSKQNRLVLEKKSDITEFLRLDAWF